MSQKSLRQYFNKRPTNSLPIPNKKPPPAVILREEVGQEQERGEGLEYLKICELFDKVEQEKKRYEVWLAGAVRPTERIDSRFKNW